MNTGLFKSLMLFACSIVVVSANAKSRQRRAHIASPAQVAQAANASWGGGGGGSYAGQSCTRGDRDPIKCKMCAIYGEDNRSSQGMHAVAGVIETRVRSGAYGSDPCSVVHSRGQFVGAWRRLPNNPALLSAMESAARNASANGYMGFRSYCKKGRATRIGGNCYGTADAERFIILDPTMTAEDVDLQSLQNLQFAELPDDEDAG